MRLKISDSIIRERAIDESYVIQAQAIEEIEEIINSMIKITSSKKLERDIFKLFTDKFEFIGWNGEFINETEGPASEDLKKHFLNNIGESYSEERFNKYLEQNNYQYPLSKHIIYNPNGSQSNPDYYVFMKGICFPFQAKSGRIKIKLNSTFYSPETIYFVTNANGKNIISLGKDIEPDLDKIKSIWNEHNLESATLSKKYNDLLKPYNFYKIYNRKDIDDSRNLPEYYEDEKDILKSCVINFMKSKCSGNNYINPPRRKRRKKPDIFSRLFDDHKPNNLL